MKGPQGLRLLCVHFRQDRCTARDLHSNACSPCRSGLYAGQEAEGRVDLLRGDLLMGSLQVNGAGELTGFLMPKPFPFHPSFQ